MAGNLSVGIKIGASVAPSLGSAFKTVEERTQKVGRALRQTWSRRDTAANVIHYRDKLQELKQKQAQLGYSSERLNQGIAEVEQQYREAKSQAKEYGMSVANIDREHRQMADSAALAERRMGRLNTMQANREKRGQLQGQIMGTVGTAMAAAAPIKAAIDFEAKMADVRKVVDFEKPEQFKAMGQDILEMSGKMPMAAEGIADIVAAAGQSNIARGKIKGFAESAVKMGTAFDISGRKAGSAMATWRSSFGLAQEEAVGLADAINHLSNNMNSEASAVTKTVTRIGALAKQAGLATEETAALSSAMISAGAAPERASTAIKKLTSTLASGEGAEAFKAIGMEAQTVAKRMQEDAQGTITEIFQRIKGVSDERRLKVISDLFGEAGKEAIAPLIGELGKLEKAFGQVADKSQYAGSMQAEYEERQKATAAQLNQLSGKVNHLAVNLGYTLLPTINAVTGAVGDKVATLAELSDEYPRVTKVVVGAAAGLAGFKVASLGAKFAATVLSDGLQVGKAAFDLLRPSTWRAIGGLVAYRTHTIGAAVASKAAAGWSGVKALGAGLVSLASRAIPTVIGGLRAMKVAIMTNPIGAIVGGIALAAGLIYTYWGPISDFFGKLWSGVGRDFSGAWQTIKTVLSWSPLGLLARAWSPLSSLFGSIAAAPGEALSSAWEGLKTVLSWSPLGVLAKAWGPITNLFSGLTEGIKGSLGGMWEWVKSQLLAPIQAVTDKVGKAWETVKGWFSGDEEAEKTLKIREEREQVAPVGRAVAPDNEENGGDRPRRPSRRRVGETIAAGTAAATVATPAAAAPPPVEAPAPPAQTAPQPARDRGVTIENMNVTAAPGEDAEALAERVVEQLEERTRRINEDS